LSCVGHWRRRAAQAIHAARPDDAAALEADLLLGQVLGVGRTWLYAHADEVLDEACAERADALLVRRLDGEPIAYLTGCREFRSREFRVTPDVLVPRDDTETLIEVALRLASELYAQQSGPARRPLTVLDAGTGSGIVAITLALELSVPARVIALDRSTAALGVARDNARRLGAPVEWLAADWLTCLQPGQIDLLACNPPYIESDDAHLAELTHEPAQALVAGHDGMEDLHRVIEQAVRVLGPRGALALEHGHRQGPAVRRALGDAGFERVETACDDGDRERVSSAERGAG